MARWLQSAGLQHLAAPLAGGGGPATVGSGIGLDPRAGVLPSLLLQGYGPQTIEEKQKLYTLLRSLNFNGESGGVGTGIGTASELYVPTANPSFGATSSSVDNNSFYSPELKSEFGAGLLDLHAVDDTELLSEHVMPEQFEPSPVIPKGMDDEDDAMFGGLQGTGDGTGFVTTGEKDILKETSNVAKIKVVVRKRPLNKKEISRKEDDIVDVHADSYLTVYEPKLKVDLTAYVEKHEFCFDAVLDEDVTNDEVYRETVEPIIPTIFERTKATCIAYGQTGSGKTYTMQPLPLRAAHDMVRLLHQPYYRNQNFKLWLSYFEIYGGKLFDLLCDRRKLLMREDGRQQVCIVGLQEFEVSDVQIVKDYIEKGNASRSTGSTGANEESSRSHAILQLAIKKHRDPTAEINLRSRKMTDPNDPKNGKVVGKISFIDLAGSERGADTTDNDRQTRIEGAEINKSLLALKECIRALDNDQLHIPFRGSKLTEVLRDSFVGNSRTVMISCISPNAGSCEHTLNTLRYADRVKSLSKSGNPKKDSGTASVIPSGKESATGLLSDDPFEPVPLPIQDFKPPDIPKRDVESFPNFPSSSTQEPERTSVSMIPSYTGIATRERREERDRRDEKGASTSSTVERERVVEGRASRPQQVQSMVDRERVVETRSSKPQQAQNLVERERVETRSKLQPAQNSVERENAEEEKVPKVSPPRRKGYNREERIDRQSNLPKRDNGAGPGPESVRAGVVGKQSHITQKQFQEKEVSADDGDINAILEEEEALIAAHRKEIENTMEIVREEMNLLAEVDQPGSLIDSYVTQLSFLLSRKAAGLVSLQARLARFQHRLKEQEILSRKKPSHR